MNRVKLLRVNLPVKVEAKAAKALTTELTAERREVIQQRNDDDDAEGAEAQTLNRGGCFRL